MTHRDGNWMNEDQRGEMREQARLAARDAEGRKLMAEGIEIVETLRQLADDLREELAQMRGFLVVKGLDVEYARYCGREVI